MQSQFTDKAQNALAQAGRCARGLKQGYIGTEHILVGLLKEDTGVAAKVLADNGVEVDQVMEMIRDLIAFENGVAVKDKEGYSPRAARILEEAHRQAARFGQKQTGTEHLLLALIKEGENVAVRLLNTLGANVQKIYVDTLIAIGQDGNLYKEDLGKKGDRKAKQSTLEQYSRDLTALAREGKLDPVVGREEEIRKRLLYEEVKQLSPGQKDITYQHIQELLTLFTREGNRQICLPFGIRGRRQYEEVLLTVERTDRELLEKTEVAEKYQPTLQLSPGQTGTVECEVGTVEYCVCDLAAAHEKNQEVPTNQYTKWFDYDKIKKCPVIRTRKPGDYLTIADGRGGMIHKSLKSYLVDQKIPQAERDRLPILAEGEHVLWVVGYRISEYYKVTENTKRIFKVQLIRKEFA